MKDFPAFYPPSPGKVPHDLTVPSVPFRKQINLVLVSLWLFFLLYFGLILLLTLVLAACLFGFGAGKEGMCCGWVLAPFLALPLGIMVINLFRTQKLGKGYEVEVLREENPKLFEFLECVCAETGAPMPDRVLINHEVNAAAGCEVSLASLFSSSKNRLVLGLGLLNVINMTELKALLAHEFGHLSQYNMKSGPYVRLAMRVVANILNGTHFFGFHRILQAFFIFMVKLDLALSREMEFHADLVAVSVSGSDAVVHMLYKCYWADHCLQRTMLDLETAKEHDLFSKDIFFHQRQVGKFLRSLAKDPNLGQLPELPASRSRTWQIFQPDEDELAHMWADHPSNFERELNAKADYIRTDFDRTSPWILFGEPAKLRRQVSAQFYRQCFRIKPDTVTWNNADKVQAFLNEENAETTFAEDQYGVLYNNRVLQPVDVGDLHATAEGNLNKPEDLLASHHSLYTAEVKEFAKTYHRHLEERDLLTAIRKKWYRPRRNRFVLRSRKFHTRDAKDLLKDVEKELEADLEWLKDFDAKVFIIYHELARHLDEDLAEEMFQRYRFHFIMQGMYILLEERKSPMEFMIQVLNKLAEEKNGMLDEYSFHVLIEVFRQAYDAVKLVLEEAETVIFPQLANMPAGKPIRPFLLKGHLANRPSHFDERIKPRWLVNFYQQFRDVQKRLTRLHFKSLGNILALQERIANQAEKTWESRGEK